MALASRRDSQPRTSGARGAANEVRGGSARSGSLGPAAARRAIGGFISLMVDLEGEKNFFFQFEPVKQTRAKSSQSLALAHQPPCPEPASFLAGRAGRGTRLLPSSRHPPASPAAALPGGKAVRDGNTHLQPSQAGWDQGRARISTPRPPGAAQLLPRPVFQGGSGGGRCRAGGRRFGAALAGWGCEEGKSRKRERARERERESKRESERERESALVYRFIHIIYIYVAFFFSRH